MTHDSYYSWTKCRLEDRRRYLPPWLPAPCDAYLINVMCSIYHCQGKWISSYNLWQDSMWYSPWFKIMISLLYPANDLSFPDSKQTFLRHFAPSRFSNKMKRYNFRPNLSPFLLSALKYLSIISRKRRWQLFIVGLLMVFRTRACPPPPSPSFSLWMEC